MTLLTYYRQLNEGKSRQKQPVRINYNPNNQLTTVIYAHNGVDFNDERMRLARGITFNEDGQVVLVGLRKFFNYNQLEAYTMYSEEFKEMYSLIHIQDNDQVLQLEEKLDGTMVLVGMYKDELIVGTSAGTHTPHAQDILAYIRKSEHYHSIYNYLKDNNDTLVFEFVSPDNKIVVKYSETELYLLAVVNKETFDELDTNTVKRVAKQLGVSVPKRYYLTFSETQNFLKSNVDKEGFVCYNQYHNRIKFKTEEWFKQAYLLDLNKQLNNDSKITRKFVDLVIDAYINDTLDDLGSYIQQMQGQAVKKYQTILSAINQVNQTYEDVYAQAQAILSQANELDKAYREIAHLDVGDRRIIAYVIKELKGKGLDDDRRKQYYRQLTDYLWREA